MSHVEHIAHLVLWISVVVLCVDLSLVGYVFYRRVSRRRYYANKDAARARYSETVERFIAGELSVAEALSDFSALRSRAARDALQQMLIAGMSTTNREAITQVLVRLGYVQRWTKQAFGRRRAKQLLAHLMEARSLPAFAPSWRHKFPSLASLRLFSVTRALALAQLARLSPEYAGAFIAEALHDPSPVVGRINVAAMGHHRDEFGAVALLGQLEAAVAGKTELPVRLIKTALVRYPSTELLHFLPFLQHENARLRFLVVDTIREICRREGVAAVQNDFPREVHDWFLADAVQDPSPDVRARSAQVIGFFHEPQAVLALAKLLRDDNEFVRLHAVRACAAPYFSELLYDVLARVTDPRWRVREAAVNTLASFGIRGRQILSKCFISTNDRYASEQIADELQRTGIIAEVVLTLGGGKVDVQLARQTCAKLVSLGKSAILVEIFAAEHDQHIRAALMEILLASPSPDFRSLLEQVATSNCDPLQMNAQRFLREALVKSASAAQEQD